MGIKRKALGEQRLSELKRLAGLMGFEVHEFSDVHVRVHGKKVVDYWPTRGRAWLVGSRQRAKMMEPEEVLLLATDAMDVLPEGATAHMGAI